MNDEYSNAENGGQDAKKRKRRALWALWALVGAVALLSVAFVVWRAASVSESEPTSPSSTRARLTALEDALTSARTERARIDALATKRESEARRLRSEFRRVFFRLDADERAALVDEMKSGVLSPESSERPEAAKAFAKQSEWLEVERERAALRKLSERFDAEIARAESERARWTRRLESEETLGAAVAELDAESGALEAVAVADRLRALTEDAASDADRPLESISPEEILALEEAKESAFATLVGPDGAENSEAGEENAVAENGEKEKNGEKERSGEKKATRETAGIPALPTFDPASVPDDAPVAKRLFESQGKKIVDAANREIQTALDAGATDVAFAATNDAAAELVELAETLGKDRVEEFKKLQETARKASWRPTLDALRASTKGLAESNAGWPETFALLEEAAALAPLKEIANEDETFERNLNDLQDLARYYESTDADAGGAVRRRLDALLGKAKEAEKKTEAAEKKISNAFDELFDGASPGGDPIELVVGPIFGLLGALTLGTPLGVGILLFLLLTRRSRRDGKRWNRGDYERRFPVGDGGRFPLPTSEPRPIPTGGALSGRNWQIIGLVFVVGLITAGPLVAALAAFVAALVCAGRFGTALGALGIFAFLAFALVFIALATALAIVVSIFAL